MQLQAPTGTPLYVHLPFCATKCPYCDFYSVAGEGQDTSGLIDSILAEARVRAPAEPRTVFLGGGTPSYHSVGELTRLFDGLDSITGFRSSAEEVTVECNPESLDREKAAALQALGATRLSIGFQSLDPSTLNLLGRVHDVEQSFQAFAAAREEGPARLSVDLIHAVPGQSVQSWADGLARVLALRPDHLSAYNLTFEPGTPFAAWQRQGQLTALPEEVELELFWLTRDLAAAEGYEAYEVSNFALSGEECRHNLNYWRNGPYVGIGPSAASHLESFRAGRPRSIEAWRRAVDLQDEDPAAWSYREDLAPPARLGETWWLGLRLAEGVDPREARATAGLDPDAPGPALALAEDLVDQGLLEHAGGRFRLSHRGLPLADRVAACFLEPRIE
jgi:oxygen-independent coproporphyrinogen-3 oxidase